MPILIDETTPYKSLSSTYFGRMIEQFIMKVLILCHPTLERMLKRLQRRINCKFQAYSVTDSTYVYLGIPFQNCMVGILITCPIMKLFLTCSSLIVCMNSPKSVSNIVFL